MNIVSELTLLDLKQTVLFYADLSDIQVEEWSLLHQTKHINFQLITHLYVNGDRCLISSTFPCPAPQDLQDTTRVDMHQELLDGGFDKLKNAYMLRPILPSPEAAKNFAAFIRGEHKDMLDKLTLVKFKENVADGGDLYEDWQFEYGVIMSLNCTTTLTPSGNRTINSSAQYNSGMTPSELNTIWLQLFKGGFEKFKSDFVSSSTMSTHTSLEFTDIVKGLGIPEAVLKNTKCKLCNGSGRRIMFQNEVECDCRRKK